MTTQPMKTIILDLLEQSRLDEDIFVQGLSESERAEIGTPERWSAKDNVAHRTFWHQNLIQKLTAIIQQQELQPEIESEDKTNARVLEKNRLRPWSDIHAEARQAYDGLIALAGQLSEEDFTTSSRFNAITNDYPLFTAFLGGCYEHDHEHFAQYYLDHDNSERAIEVREQSTTKVINNAEVPDWVKGWFLYHMAGFYAQLRELDKAAAYLERAVGCDTNLKERAQNDPELAVLREQQA